MQNKKKPDGDKVSLLNLCPFTDFIIPLSLDRRCKKVIDDTKINDQIVKMVQSQKLHTLHNNTKLC